MALRILFDGARAVGVEVARAGKIEEIRADREVILSAGTYQSPVLLMISGIGPAEDLELFGLKVRENLPVGQNLQDHLMAQLNYETDEPSLFGVFTPENFERLETEGSGPLTSNIPEAGGFFRTRPELDAPDIEFHYAPSMFYDQGLTAPHDSGYCFGPVVVKPSSRGWVKLRAPLPDSKPRVLCNFLETEDDRQSVIAGIRMALEIAAQEPLQKTVRKAFSVPAGDSDAEILDFVRRAGQSVYHPTSTCAIGSVVDPQLRVYGIDGLRVADASVMPTITRANTNAATIMIGERAADLIRNAEPTLSRPNTRRTLMSTTEQAVANLLNEEEWTGKIFSDGWIDAPETIDTIEPATGEVLGTAGVANAASVAAAAKSAARAQRAWAATPMAERVAVVRRAGELLELHRAEIAGWMIRESGAIDGKVAHEIGASIGQLEQAASLTPDQLEQELTSPVPGRTSTARRVPIGVVGVITPWNFPLVLAMRSLGPALVARQRGRAQGRPRTRPSAAAS